MKTAAETKESAIYRGLVGEHSARRRRRGASLSGACGKANVGMSNDNECATIHTENPRFPRPRQPSGGKSGAKGYPRGEPDDEPVNIPVPPAQEDPRPRCDTAARRRNGALKAVGVSLKADSTASLRTSGQRR